MNEPSKEAESVRGEIHWLLGQIVEATERYRKLQNIINDCHAEIAELRQKLVKYEQTTLR